ncbi:hypothetical protein ACOBV8_15070 [Pseudoalteromonas espejiana]
MSNPERVFNSMGLLVEGFDKLHSTILLGFGKKIEFSSALSETRKGSVIADIKHKVIDKVRGPTLNLSAMQFIEASKEKLQ